MKKLGSNADLKEYMVEIDTPLGACQIPVRASSHEEAEETAMKEFSVTSVKDREQREQKFEAEAKERAERVER